MKPEQTMKACQIGSRNLDDANNLHAQCYGTIGKLMDRQAALIRNIEALISCADHNRDMCEIREARALIRAIEKDCD